MGNCCSGSDYITPRPKIMLPDPTGPSTFSASRNAFLSNNFNVFKGTDDSQSLWLFLRTKGKANGIEDSYFVLENFWRAPFSDEGDVLCWCHLPAYHQNRAYRTTGYEEHGISPDLHSEIYWTNSNYIEQSRDTPMVLWKRREWQFSVRLGFYRDRYMEEPLGLLEISSKGWIIQKVIGGPGKSLIQPQKKINEAQYVFKDKDGLSFPIAMDMILKGCSKLQSYDSCMFGCIVTPPHCWFSDKKILTATRAGYEPGLAFLVAFVCANILSPESIAHNLQLSQLCKKIP
ncbi:hypothetical protein O6H91_07G100500 [Diphasiastrum complanatum]|uniref:Uncharacterized protein n=1 Tax=Diphasiastrum complanatum TaxID=34168 RepID=A0ACC2D8G5_DIPCM|nr:hypothetical protein O6H91_07G100500 [Diphasiastrum complanatum]